MPKRKRPKLLDVEFYLDAAERHGDISDGDHEPGDLRVFLSRMWSLLTTEQRLAFARDPVVHDTLEPVLDVEKLLLELKS